MNSILDQAFEQRLIILLENGEYNGFNQVLLNEDQFKRISDILAENLVESDEELRDGFEIVDFEVDENKTFPGELFEGVASILK